MEPQPASEWLHLEHVGHVRVAHLTPPMLADEAVVQPVGNELLRLVKQAPQSPLLVDLSGVLHLSSRMLARLIVLYQQVQAVSGRLALCGMCPDVADVFAVTRLDRIFRIFPDQQQALQHFSAG